MPGNWTSAEVPGFICVSPVDHPNKTGSGRGARAVMTRHPKARHFKFLLIQAAWFLKHTCVSSQDKGGAQEWPHGEAKNEHPSTCGRVFQNPVNWVCNSRVFQHPAS